MSALSDLKRIAGFMPGLFSVAGEPVKSFQLGGLRSVHADVLKKAQGVRLLDKPALDLKQIRPFFLYKNDFMAKFEEVTSMPKEGIDFDTFQAFCVSRADAGAVSYDQYFNADAMKAVQKESGRSARSVMLHEIAGTIYGDIIQKTYAAAGHSDVPAEIDLENTAVSNMDFILAGEGWACFLSQSPFDTDFILNTERAYLTAMDQKNTGAMDMLRAECLSDRHFLVGLALTKIGMQGPQFLLPLMNTPPGVKPDGTNLFETDIALNFWELYRKFNHKIKQGILFGLKAEHIPFKDFGTGSLTASDLTK